MHYRTHAGAAGGMLAALLCAQTALAQFDGFLPPDNYPLASRGRDAVILDVNSDGFMDVAVAIEDFDPGTLDSVSVFLNNGDGTFAAPLSYGVGVEPAGIVAGDFNKDGLPDLAVANTGTNDVSVLTNLGGTFSPEAIYAVPGTPVSLDVGNIDGDTYPDLLVANETAQTVTILNGSVTGLFSVGASYTTLNFGAPGGENPREVVLADLNANGLADAIVAASDHAVVMYNTGFGGFFSGEFAFYLPAGDNVQSVAVGDLTGDARPDIVIASRTANALRLYSNNANTTYPNFTQFGTLSTPAAPISVILADLGNAPVPPPGAGSVFAPDGDLDILVSCENAHQLGVSLNDGGSLSSVQTFATTGFAPQRIAAADLDSDGDIDVAVPQIGGGLDIFRNQSTIVGGPDPIARIDSPVDFTSGGCVTGIVPVIGVADVPGGFYDHDELRFRPLSSSTWIPIGTASSPFPEPGGLLYNWDTTALTEGYYILQLEVFSISGLTSTDEVALFVNQDFDTVTASSSSIAGANVCIDGTVWDSHAGSVEYTVDYAPAGTGAYSPVDPANPVYFGTRINQRLANWNSTLVPDGFYDIRVRATNACGLTKQVVYPIEIDNTPPVAVIDSPTNCDSFFPDTTIEIYGTAFDTNMRSWAVQYTGGPANNWVTIATGNTNVVSDLLAKWDTTGLPSCCYTIRLVATDEPILNCHDRRSVQFLTSIEIGCAVDFNNDGFLDSGDINLFVSLFLAGCN